MKDLLVMLSLLVSWSSFAGSLVKRECIEVQPNMSYLTFAIQAMEANDTERMSLVDMEIHLEGTQNFAGCQDYVIEYEGGVPTTMLKLMKMDSARYCVYSTEGSASSSHYGWVCRKQVI